MILCADDYGLNHAISDGILDLIQAKKINSISCISTTNCWKEKAKELPLNSKSIEVGLHLTLTNPKPVHSIQSTLKSLVFKSYLKHLKKEEIAREIQSQIDLFKKYTNRFPDYVDGHEFCHHFPVVRESLLECAEKFQFAKNRIYVRVFRPGSLPLLENIVFWCFNHLASLPSKKLAKLLKKQNILSNSRLLGFHPYDWEPKKYFNYYFKQKPSNKDIFFCHPGRPSDDLSDDLRFYRPRVYDFMMSSEFDHLLKDYNISLKSFRFH